MKLCNIRIDGCCHLAVETERGLVDATAAGFAYDMDAVVAGADLSCLEKLAADPSLPVVENAEYLNVLNRPGKLVCVGLNYVDHATGVQMNVPKYPILFSKFANSLAPHGAEVTLPEWESTYDYEAEMVIVMGKSAWNVSEEEAMDCVFGYSCGNDLSCRDAQLCSGQWLIGKAMPGFGPCGPVIVTADSFDPGKGISVQCYVNGQLRQNGNTNQMLFNCAKIISYASKYIGLEPGDLIYTGTPSGVALEKRDTQPCWLKKGDRVDVVIEGIGTLTNYMV